MYEWGSLIYPGVCEWGSMIYPGGARLSVEPTDHHLRELRDAEGHHSARSKQEVGLDVSTGVRETVCVSECVRKTVCVSE